MLRLKEGVRLTGLVPQMALAARVLEGVLEAHGYDTIITSGNDSTHKIGSLHYAGAALDFRTHHMKPEDKLAVAQDLRARLGAEFDVLFEYPGGESEHLHLEYDPAPVRATTEPPVA